MVFHDSIDIGKNSWNTLVADTIDLKAVMGIMITIIYSNYLQQHIWPGYRDGSQ